MPDVLLSCFYLTIFLLIIFKNRFFEIKGLSRKVLASFFGIRYLSAIAISLIYTYYYPRHTSDIFNYFGDAQIFYNSLFINPLHYIKLILGIDFDSPDIQQYISQTDFWFRLTDNLVYNDCHTIIRIDSIFLLFSFGNYYPINVFSAFLSFCGMTALHKFFISHENINRSASAICCFLIPSMLIWSSSPLKEFALITGLGFLLLSIKNLLNKSNFLKWGIVFIISFFTLLLTKYYVLGTLIPGLIIYCWHDKFPRPTILIKSSIIILLIFSGLIINEWLGFYPILELIAQKQNDFINYSSIEANSYIELTRLTPDILGFIKVVPEALINSFLRPSIIEIKSIMMIIPAIENLLIIILFILIFIFPTPKNIDKKLFYLSIIFSSCLMLLIGLTTPVLGAMVRYKIPVLPFLYLILASQINWNQLYKKIIPNNIKTFCTLHFNKFIKQNK